MRKRIGIAIAAVSVMCTVPQTVARAAQAQLVSTHFTSPSGNIDCQMFRFDKPLGADVTVSAECTVDNATWKNPPKKPADCDLDFDPFEIGLSSDTVGSKAKTTVTVGGCRGDIGPTCSTGDCYTLNYGDSRTVGNVTCTSRRTGITCVSITGKRKGFVAARAKYTIIR